jgi:DNA-nicking Smr family endonuclease
MTAARIENRVHSPERPAPDSDMNGSSHDDDVSLFRRHVDGTRPLKGNGERVLPVRRAPRRASPEAPPAGPGATEGGFEPDPVGDIERGSRIEFARPGLQRREIRRLRRGHHRVQDQLDLHGLLASEAERAVLEFVDHSRARGLRCVRIIHGKGRSSTGGRPVLKAVVDRWLRRCDGVLAFCPAPDNAGGTGAVHVLLRG